MNREGLETRQEAEQSFPVSVLPWFCQSPAPFRRLVADSWSFHLNGRNEHECRLWPIPPPHSQQSKYWTHFSQAMSSKCSDTKMAFFRQTNQDKINFVWGQGCFMLSGYSVGSRPLSLPVKAAQWHMKLDEVNIHRVTDVSFPMYVNSKKVLCGPSGITWNVIPQFGHYYNLASTLSVLPGGLNEKGKLEIGSV